MSDLRFKSQPPGRRKEPFPIGVINMQRYQYMLYVFHVTQKLLDGRNVKRPALIWHQPTGSLNFVSTVVFESRDQLIRELIDTGLLKKEDIASAENALMHGSLCSLEIFIPYEKLQSLNPPITPEPGFVKTDLDVVGD